MGLEETVRPKRLLRVREFSADTRKQPKRASGGGPKSRFVAPYNLQGRDHAAIEEILKQAQLSDDEGRRLFITAMEYEVATYCANPDEQPTTVAVETLPLPGQSRIDEELAGLGGSAQQLANRLSGSHKGTRNTLLERLTETDAFGREHGVRYLMQLELELGRIIEACDQRQQEPEQPRMPALGENTRSLIVQLARIYGECLEVGMDPVQMEIFGRILCIIRDSAQISLPCDEETLTDILAEAQ